MVKEQDNSLPNGPETLAPRVFWACVLSSAFAILFVVLRFFTAHRILQKFYLDDCQFHP